MDYRRVFVRGGAYFFTVVTAKRRPILASQHALALLRDAFRATAVSRPFVVEAIVVLPDHLHCIWTLPPGDADFSTRWRLIKTRFTRRAAPALCQGSHPLGPVRGNGSIWQQRFWEHLLRDERDFERHFDYVHYNPVRHGYVSSPALWRYSSFHRAVRDGVYPVDWGAEAPDLDGVGRE